MVGIGSARIALKWGKVDGVTEEGVKKEEWPIQWELSQLEVKGRRLRSLGHGDCGRLGHWVRWGLDIGCITNKL